MPFSDPKERTMTPRNKLREPLAEALDALRSIWRNTNDPWIRQRAWGVLSVNLSQAQLAELDSLTANSTANLHRKIRTMRKSFHTNSRGGI